MTATATVQLHRTEKGNWVKCTASVRSCPRGQHVTIAGEASDAVQFFDEMGQGMREDIRVAFEAEAKKSLTTWNAVEAEAEVAARETFDLRTQDLRSYTLPKPQKKYTDLTQEQRYAQAVTNMALNFLADKGAGQPHGEETIPLAKFERDVTTASKNFAGVGAGDQEATRVSLNQTLTILRQNASDEVLYGKTQRVIDIRPAMFALEGKFLTLDTEYKAYEPEPVANTGELLADAQRSFDTRSGDWDHYEYPAGLDGISSPADSPRKSAAQALTREAIMSLIGQRLESLDASGGAAPYTAVRQELKEFAAEDTQDIPSYNPHLRAQSVEQRKAWLREIDAILRTEASMQNVAGAQVPLVDLQAAVRALEERGLSSDLSPAPEPAAKPEVKRERVQSSSVLRRLARAADPSREEIRADIAAQQAIEERARKMAAQKFLPQERARFNL